MALILVAILVGAVLPLQAGINAQLRTQVGHPLVAAFISFLVGTAALAAAMVAARIELPATRTLTGTPGWLWTGGLLGAAYIAAAVVLAPRLGAATLIASVVTGQMIASLVLDHFGWAGFAQHSISPGRAIGAALVILGVILIRR